MGIFRRLKRMNSTEPSLISAEIRKAIVRQIPHDALRITAMWLVPLLFLLLNKWAWHWSVFALLVSVGVFVIGGTTSSLSPISVRTLPPDHASIWTPVRCVVYVAMYLAFWGVTYLVVN